MSPITVVVAVPDRAARAACASALAGDPRVRVVAHVQSTFDMVAAVLRHRPRVLVLGAGVARRSLAVLAEVLGAAGGRTRILVVGPRATRAEVLDVLAHGAHGHLERRLIHGALAKAVRVVDEGQAWCSRKLVPALVDRLFGAPAAAATAGRTSIGRWSNGQPPATR